MDHTILDRLEAQHREAEQILHRLSTAQTAPQQQPLVEKLRNTMTEHMRIEESDVYPELERFAIDLGVEAEIEHDLTRKGLQQLSDMVGRPGFGALVAMVHAGIGHHVEEEEKEIFPRLRDAPAAAEDVRGGDLRNPMRKLRSAKSNAELVTGLPHNSTIA